MNNQKSITETVRKSYLYIAIADQKLSLVEQGEVVNTYTVSTAKNGPGEMRGSECTPTGWHKIRAKIGAGKPVNTVFVGRRATGEIYNQQLLRQHPGRDWILSRILWLGGKEPGHNRYGRVDTAWRYIYIHGCPDELIQGQPGSHGCVRMHNADIIELFDRIPIGLNVYIHV